MAMGVETEGELLGELGVVTIGATYLAATVNGVELHLLAQVDELVAEFVYLVAEFVYLVVLAGAVAL